MQTVHAIAIGWVVVCFIGALALIILWKIFTGSIALAGLLSEASPDGTGTKGSMSRLQFLIFTFVITGLYLTLCLEAGAFLEIPNQVLGLLGISTSGYVLSKGIQANQADKAAGRASAAALSVPASRTDDADKP